jgi:hypothetical protein
VSGNKKILQEKAAEATKQKEEKRKAVSGNQKSERANTRVQVLVQIF